MKINKKIVVISVAMLMPVVSLTAMPDSHGNPFAGFYADAAIGLGNLSGKGTLSVDDSAHSAAQTLSTFNESKQGAQGILGAGYRFALSPHFLIGAGLNLMKNDISISTSFNPSDLFFGTDVKTTNSLAYAPYASVGYSYKQNLFSLYAGPIFQNTTINAKVVFNNLPVSLSLPTLKHSSTGFLVGLHLAQTLTSHIDFIEDGSMAYMPNISDTTGDGRTIMTKTLRQATAVTLGLSYHF